MTPPSQSLATAVVAALAASGVRDVVYCPGSRSAPLAYALARAEKRGDVRVHIRLDERSAAFVAIGLSRAGALSSIDEGGAAGAPVAVVTTSGGAVAELHAGVAEAWHSHIPLIVVSADRPAELRGVGASQTTTQVGIFGPHVRGQWDIPADTPGDRRLGALIARAVATACGMPLGVAGPVHVNVAFKDPLVPMWEGGADTDLAQVDVSRSVSAVRVVPPRIEATPWTQCVDPALRTVIVAGDGADRRAGQWALAARIPLLAEPSSALTTSPAWIPHQQSLLSDPRLAHDIEQVVVTGRPTLSRVVTALLSRPEVRLVVQATDSGWVDPGGNVDCVVTSLALPEATHDDSEWAGRWSAASSAVSAELGADVRIGAGHARPNEPLTMLSAVDVIWKSGQDTLVLGASNSIRAFDLVATAPGRDGVVSNRGLAGIDGTIATSMGLAWGSGRAVRAVMGDLTFHHDSASLALTESNLEPDLQIVVLDDGGGSIFASLEHGRPEYSEVYDRWFATVQLSDIEGLARAHGASCVAVHTVADLEAALAGPISGRSVIHVRVPRDPELLTFVRNASIERN